MLPLAARPELGDVGDELRVFADGRVSDGEDLLRSGLNAMWILCSE
jgi:hypothetical protein